MIVYLGRRFIFLIWKLIGRSCFGIWFLWIIVSTFEIVLVDSYSWQIHVLVPFWFGAVCKTFFAFIRIKLKNERFLIKIITLCFIFWLHHLSKISRIHPISLIISLCCFPLLPLQPSLDLISPLNLPPLLLMALILLSDLLVLYHTVIMQELKYNAHDFNRTLKVGLCIVLNVIY